MLKSWITPGWNLVRNAARFIATTEHRAQIIDGKGMAQDLQVLLKDEMKEWSKRTCPPR